MTSPRPAQARSHRLAGTATALFGALGLVALLAAPIVYFDASELRARHAFVAALPAFGSERSGEPFALEGRVASSVPELRDGLVVYVRERYGRRGFAHLDGETQPLALVTGGGARVSVVNTDYTLDPALDPWARTRRELAAATATSGAIRITGIAAGDAVMVVGRRAAGGSPHEVVAESLAGFDRATYLTTLAREITIADRLALTLLPVSTAALGLAFALGRRVLRAP